VQGWAVCVGRVEECGPGCGDGGQGGVAGQGLGDFVLVERERVGLVGEQVAGGEPASAFEQGSADEPGRPHEGQRNVVVSGAVAPAGVVEEIVEARTVRDRDPVAHGIHEALRTAAERSEDQFAVAFEEATTTDPRLGAVAAVLLYRTLGVTLTHGAAAAASLWPMAIRCAQVNPDGVARAGFGSRPDAGERLFDAIVDSPSGVVFTDDTWEETWRRIKTDDGLVHVEIPELLAELADLASETPPGDDPEWPLLLSAGERRSFTANTILRDPAWRKKDLDGALRVSPADAERIGLASGDAAKLSTKRSHAVVKVAVDDTVQPGHISLPNGFGLDHLEGGARSKTGVGTNEFTASEDRDPWAGTPWHKTTPARLEPV
jgi:anaerobic selenocysteine-containing dehydrogenase